MLFAYAAQRVPLSIIGPMQYIVPTMNFLIGWLLYDEALPVSRVIGFALVWVGLAVMTVDGLRRIRAAARWHPRRQCSPPDRFGSLGRSTKRATGIGGAFLVFAAFVSACGTDAADFRSSAERFIEGERMSSESGTTFTDAVCQEPTTTAVGTMFHCSAIDTEGVEWSFDVSIVDDSNFQITGRRTN